MEGFVEGAAVPMEEAVGSAQERSERPRNLRGQFAGRRGPHSGMFRRAANGPGRAAHRRYPQGTPRDENGGMYVEGREEPGIRRQQRKRRAAAPRPPLDVLPATASLRRRSVTRRTGSVAAGAENNVPPAEAAAAAANRRRSTRHGRGEYNYKDRWGHSPPTPDSFSGLSQHSVATYDGVDIDARPPDVNGDSDYDDDDDDSSGEPQRSRQRQQSAQLPVLPHAPLPATPPPCRNRHRATIEALLDKRCTNWCHEL